MEALYTLLGVIVGSVGVEALRGVNERRKLKMERRAAREDKADRDTEARLESLEGKVDALAEATRWTLFDRIRHFGQSYIAAGEVDFDDRRILVMSHDCYHKLGGNGDLDALMAEVDKLPLKTGG